MLKSIVRRTVFSGALVVAALTAHAQNYTFKYFHDPSPQAYVTEGTDISRTGELVGWYTNYANGVWGFSESEGSYKTISIPTTGSPYTVINAIDDADALVGYGAVNGFKIDSSGNLHVIKVPASWKATTVSNPVGINSSETIVGNVSTTSSPGEGFVLQDGAYKAYRVPASYSTTLHDISDNGVIVGSYSTSSSGNSIGFVLRNGVVTKIEFPGAIATVATSTNDAGVVVGYYYNKSRVLIPFYYDGGVYTQIATPGEYACVIGHIKNSGEIVGTCTNSSTFVTEAFVGTPVSK